ncbi:MAG TPA: maleylpyruvate isomerase N-terminal domain-containing protein [Kribbella sp.]|nr:maleylpyruvate isomerase N-terminal domain-containing protein [Kribbella sp.]
MRAPERPALPLRLAATLGRTYGRLTETVARLSDADFERPTRCEGMAVGPLLVHLLYDAERALVAFATLATVEPDRDFVTYWHDFPGRAHGHRPEPHLRFVQVVASAYERPSESLVKHWTELSEAAVRAAALAAAEPERRVGTQGHVLKIRDFVATLVFEATVHHLDLIVDLPDAPEPDPEALRLTARTLDGLFGPEAWDVIGWDTRTYVLKATGRLALTPEDVEMLGPYATRLPLIG